jgi:hypothetical protein
VPAERETVWFYERTGALTKLSIKSEFRKDGPDRIEIERKGPEYEVRFLDVSHTWCGFGSDFPAAVLLRRGDPQCKVTEKP